VNRQSVQDHGITRWVEDRPVRHTTAASTPDATKEHHMPTLRHEIGDVLRDMRQRQGRTLREVSHDARVSLGYLSEVERGQKEASSELLASICAALDVPLSTMLREVSDRVAEQEGVIVPDTVPDELTVGLEGETGSVDLSTLAGR